MITLITLKRCLLLFAEAATCRPVHLPTQDSYIQAGAGPAVLLGGEISLIIGPPKAAGR